jgi:hypothetical protein
MSEHLTSKEERAILRLMYYTFLYYFISTRLLIKESNQMKHPNVPTSIDYTDKCNGCGLCCVLEKEEDCQYLKRLGNGLTLCKIHGHHTGSIIKVDEDKGLVWHCADIMDIPTLYEDCPYNEDKILIKLQQSNLEE